MFVVYIMRIFNFIYSIILKIGLFILPGLGFYFFAGTGNIFVANICNALEVFRFSEVVGCKAGPNMPPGCQEGKYECWTIR